MSLRDYFNFPVGDPKYRRFTLSSEYLFMRHNDGEDFVLNLKTKKVFINHKLMDRDYSLSRIFDVPITENHEQTIYFGEKILYSEYISKKDNKHSLDHKKYNIFKPITFNGVAHFYNNDNSQIRTEKLTEDFIPYGTSERKSDFSRYYQTVNIGHYGALGELNHGVEPFYEGMYNRLVMGIDPVNEPGLVYAPYITVLQTPEPIQNYDPIIARAVSNAGHDLIDEYLRRYNPNRNNNDPITIPNGILMPQQEHIILEIHAEGGIVYREYIMQVYIPNTNIPILPKTYHFCWGNLIPSETLFGTSTTIRQQQLDFTFNTIDEKGNKLNTTNWNLLSHAFKYHGTIR